MNIFIGVDIGKDGAIVAIDDNGDVVMKTVMPTVGTGKLEYNPEKIKNILQELRPTNVSIENPSGMQGYSKNAVASLKYCVGLFEGICVGLNIPYTLINPRSWQSKMWDGHKKVTYRYEGKDKNDTKATSLLVVHKMYPGMDLRKSERARNPHDGIVDAILIANYSRKQHNGRY